MKKVIPFNKKVTFNTMINEVTDIVVKEDLKLNNENELEGNIIVDGKYKLTEASITEEEFHYDFPCVIAIDTKYDTSNLEISISDFNFEIINEEDLNINVDILLDKLEEIRKEEIKIPVEIEEIVEEVDEELEEKEDIDNSIGSIFNNIDNSETFSTYHVYIVRETDTLEDIMDKYSVSRDELADYNDLDDIKIGTKLIIPCSNV